MGRLLTTGQAAKMLGVSIQTVIRWCDSGLLKYEKLPRSNHRRVFEDDLKLFADRN